MKLLVMDLDDHVGNGLDLAMRAKEYGHEATLWSEKPHDTGREMVNRAVGDSWKNELQKADLTVLTENCEYPKGLEEAFVQGYPIFGTCPLAAELELDREKGQEILDRYGINTLPFEIVNSADEAIKAVVKAGKPFVMKPWGGVDDKSTTCVARTPDEAIWTLNRWKEEGKFPEQLMLQQKVEGEEIGISGFFGPGGWNRALEESWEYKKFLTGDLGQNTGEMGTVIRHVSKSKLFDILLEPLTDYLHLCRYVGDCSVNAIIDRRGRVWPLEFTMRLGWPDFLIRQEVIQGDPVEWMRDLVYGRDSLEVRTDITVGIEEVHGDFPWKKDEDRVWSGFPVEGITPDNRDKLHFKQAMGGKYKKIVGGAVRLVEGTLTAGATPLVVTGSGGSVRAAKQRAYDVVEAIKWPSNVMYRTDIGDDLEESLPLLQKHGFAMGMRF